MMFDVGFGSFGSVIWRRVHGVPERGSACPLFGSLCKGSFRSLRVLTTYCN